jgi:hypothetical protein
MATILDRYISSNGEVLIPVNSNPYPDLVSDNGIYYLAMTHSTSTPVQGSPMGLLLALTYPVDQ